MIRAPLSPHGAALVKALAPSPMAILGQCRSIAWKILEREGERIHIEWAIRSELGRKRAQHMAERGVSVSLAGATLASLAIELADDRLICRALVLIQ